MSLEFNGIAYTIFTPDCMKRAETPSCVASESTTKALDRDCKKVGRQDAFINCVGFYQSFAHFDKFSTVTDNFFHILIAVPLLWNHTKHYARDKQRVEYYH